MTEASNVYVEESTEQTTTNTSYTTVASGTLSASTTYVLLSSAFINGSNAAALSANAQLNINSSAQARSEVNIEPTSTTAANKRCHSYLDVYTTGGSTETIAYQIKSSSGDTARADSIAMIGIDLSGLTEGTDYKFGEDDDSGAPVSNGTTWASRASATITNPNANDVWYVFAYFQWNVKNVTVRFEGRINRDSGTETAPTFSVEGENTSEIRNALICRPYTITDTSSHTFTADVQDSGSATQNEHVISRVFCIRAEVFETHAEWWSEAEWNNSGSTSFAEITGSGLNPTPATAGNWVVGGSAVMDVRTAGKLARIRVQESGTTLMTGIDSHYMASGNDNVDEDPMFFFTRKSFSTAAKDIDFDGSFDVSFDQPSTEDHGFFAFSLELAASASVTGTLVGDIGQLSGSISGAFGPSGTLVGDIGQLSGAVTGYMVPAGALVGDIGQLTGSLSGSFGPSGTLAGDIGQLSGNISGSFSSGSATGTLAGDIGQLTGSISGAFGPSGTVAGDIGQLSGSVTGAFGPSGTLAGDIGQLTGDISGTFTPTATGTLTGVIGQLTGDISGLSAQPVTGTLAGDIGQLTGSISGDVTAPSLGGGVSFTELRKGEEREREIARQKEFNRKAREQREKETRLREGKQKAKRRGKEEETVVPISPPPLYEADTLREFRPPMVFGLFPPEEMSDFMRRAMGYGDTIEALREADLVRQAEFDADDELAVEMLLMSI